MNEFYKTLSDIQLLELLLIQNNDRLDPFLVAILKNKGLIIEGEKAEIIKQRLDFMKAQDYDHLLSEYLKLKEKANDQARELAYEKKVNNARTNDFNSLLKRYNDALNCISELKGETK